MRKLLSANTLLCFSPAVMVATIVIELALAAWVITRYAVNRPRRLILTLLVLLAAFQLAEFNVCSSALPDVIWSRLGYIFITFLPPLGIHLVCQLRSERRTRLITASYTLAAAFAVTFALSPSGLNHGVCTGNYVVLALSQPLAALYAIYYYALELLALGLALMPLPKAKTSVKHALRWLALGYVLIIVPTFLLVALLPATRTGIPSIMCGFAVLFALILGLRIAPLAGRK